MEKLGRDRYNRLLKVPRSSVQRSSSSREVSASQSQASESSESKEVLASSSQTSGSSRRDVFGPSSQALASSTSAKKPRYKTVRKSTGGRAPKRIVEYNSDVEVADKNEEVGHCVKRSRRRQKREELEKELAELSGNSSYSEPEPESEDDKSVTIPAVD